MSFIDRLFLYKGKEKTGKIYSSDSDSGKDKPQPEDIEQLQMTEMGASELETASPEEEIYEVLEREILPAKIICPDCGGITLEGLEFCDKCGGELL